MGKINPGITIKTTKCEGKRRKRSPGSEPQASSEAEKYGHMAATAVGALALEWLEEIEDIRSKTSNMQGRLSGHLKKNVLKLKEIVQSLVGKAEAAGDPLFLKMRNSELSQQLSEARTMCEKSKKD